MEKVKAVNIIVLREASSKGKFVYLQRYVKDIGFSSKYVTYNSSH